jgi:hypothetical protein
MPGYKTKDPLVFYYRDPTECIEFLLKNPLFSGKIDYYPRKDFDHTGNRVYSEWISSDGAWDLQVRTSLLSQLNQLLISWIHRAEFHNMRRY